MLPKYDMHDEAVMDLYQAFELSVMDRAKQTSTRAHADVDAAVRGLSKDDDSFIDISGMLRHSPAMLAYAGVVAYVVGWLYLRAYNTWLLPNHAFEYGYFSTVSSLIGWLPLAIGVSGWFVPIAAAGTRVGKRLQTVTTIYVAAQRDIASYSKMFTLLIQRQALGLLRESGWLAHPYQLARTIWRLARMAATTAGLPRGMSRTIRRGIGLAMYVPLVVSSSRRPNGLVGLFALNGLYSLLLLLGVPLLTRFPAWASWMTSTLALAVFVALAAIALRAIVFSFRKRRHEVAAVMVGVSVVLMLVSFSVVAGIADATAELDSAPSAVVLMDDGSTHEGKILYTASSTDVFLWDSDTTARLSAASVQTVTLPISTADVRSPLVPAWWKLSRPTYD